MSKCYDLRVTGSTMLLLIFLAHVTIGIRYLGTESAYQKQVFDDWQNKTGKKVDTTFKVYSDVFPEAQQDLKLNVNLFDVYQLHPVMSSFAEKKWIRDLTNDVKDPKFNWADIALSVRKWQSEYGNSAWSVPIDTDSYTLYYRRDLIFTPPTTWEEYIEVARQWHGKDINGDGIPDFGACTITKGHFNKLAYTIAATVMKFKKGTRQGYLFDISNREDELMTNLLQTKGWTYTMELVKEIWKYGQGKEVAVAEAFGHWRAGRCATFISFGSSGTQTVRPGNYIHGKLGVARAPGSSKVYDRFTDSLVTCNDDLCAFMEAGKLNRPSLNVGGVMLVINGQLKGEALEDALDFCAYYSNHVDVRRGGSLNPFRESHFNATWFTEAEVPWDRLDAEMYTSALRQAIDFSHTVGIPPLPNTRVVKTNIDRAIMEFVRLGQYNTTTDDLATIMSNCVKRIDEESLADGYSPLVVETVIREAYNLPPYVPPSEALAADGEDSIAYIAIIIVILVLLLLATSVVLAWLVLRRPPGIDSAPTDQTLPYGVVVVSTAAATMKLQQCARDANCFLTHQVGSMVFVTKDISSVVTLLQNLDNLNEEILHVGVHFGRGTIVPPRKRSEEPRFGGRVVDTAVELHTIACSLAAPQGVLTVGEVQQMMLDRRIDAMSSSKATAGDSTTGSNGRVDSMMTPPTFKNAGDKKFKGGIVRRIVSVACGNILHPPNEDVRNAALSIAETDPSVDEDDDMACGAKYSLVSSKTVHRRGSVLHLDCTRVKSTADLFHYHDVFASWVEHFGGEVDSMTSIGAIATFGVHKANTLHEQNACRCALKLRGYLESTYCITSGSMISSTSPDKSVASGTPICTAVLMNNHLASISGPSKIFVQHDVVFASGLPSLPHDVLQFVDTYGNVQASFVAHQLFHEDEFPFAACPPDTLRTFKQSFELLRQGKYLGALQRVEPIKSFAPHCGRLLKMIRLMLSAEGDQGNGYCRRIAGTVKDCFMPDETTAAVYNNSLGSVSDGGFLNLASASNLSTNVSTESGSGESHFPKKETATERSRRTRGEVEQALKARSNNTVEESGLISMFVSPAFGEEEDTENGAHLSFPTTITDVTGVKWTRSEQPLSAGSFAAVYRGVSTVGRVVSLKCLDIENSTNHISTEEIAAEVSTLSSYIHENIIGYITYGFVGRYCFIVMEHASGGSLYRMIRDFGGLCQSTVKTYVREALRGLEYLHSQKVVHCDIKPHNILIGSDGICKIADFGSTIELGFVGSEDQVLARGTPAYMSPEMCRGEEGPASDMWSLGITIIELITGKTPWERLGNVNHFIAKLGADEEMRPNIPVEAVGPEFEELVQALLQRDPTKRPTASEALAYPVFL